MKKLLPFLVLFSMLTGCGTIQTHSINQIHDVTSNDLVIYKNHELKPLSTSAEGAARPTTAQEFYNDPNRWKNINLSGEKMRFTSLSTSIIDILPTGTPYHYTKVTLNSWGAFADGELIVDSGKYKDTKFRFSCPWFSDAISNKRLKICLERTE